MLEAEYTTFTNTAFKGQTRVKNFWRVQRKENMFLIYYQLMRLCLRGLHRHSGEQLKKRSRLIHPLILERTQEETEKGS